MGKELSVPQQRVDALVEKILRSLEDTLNMEDGHTKYLDPVESATRDEYFNTLVWILNELGVTHPYEQV